MNIVVKLSDKDYQVMLTKVMLACYGCEIIELPKGHGRLIDVDKLQDYFWDNRSKLFQSKDCIFVIDNATTIIEADRSEEE